MFFHEDLVSVDFDSSALHAELFGKLATYCAGRKRTYETYQFTVVGGTLQTSLLIDAMDWIGSPQNSVC